MVHVPCTNDWKKWRATGIPSCMSLRVVTLETTQNRSRVLFSPEPWILWYMKSKYWIFTDNQPSLGIYILCLRSCTWLNAIQMMWSQSMDPSIASFDKFQEFIDMCYLPFLCVNLASWYLRLQHRYFEGLNVPMKQRGILPNPGTTYMSRALLLIIQCLLCGETEESELLLLLSHPSWVIISMTDN